MISKTTEHYRIYTPPGKPAPRVSDPPNNKTTGVVQKTGASALAKGEETRNSGAETLFTWTDTLGYCAGTGDFEGDKMGVAKALPYLTTSAYTGPFVTTTAKILDSNGLSLKHSGALLGAHPQELDGISH